MKKFFILLLIIFFMLSNVSTTFGDYAFRSLDYHNLYGGKINAIIHINLMATYSLKFMNSVQTGHDNPNKVRRQYFVQSRMALKHLEELRNKKDPNYEYIRHRFSSARTYANKWFKKGNSILKNRSYVMKYIKLMKHYAWGYYKSVKTLRGSPKKYLQGYSVRRNRANRFLRAARHKGDAQYSYMLKKFRLTKRYANRMIKNGHRLVSRRITYKARIKAYFRRELNYAIKRQWSSMTKNVHAGLRNARAITNSYRGSRFYKPAHAYLRKINSYSIKLANAVSQRKFVTALAYATTLAGLALGFVGIFVLVGL